MALEYIEAFVQGKSIRTRRTWRSLAKKFAKFLEAREVTVTTVQPIHVREFIYAQESVNTRNTYKIFFKAFFRAIGRKDLVDDLRQTMRDIKAEEKFQVDLTEEEVRRIIDATTKPEAKLAWSLMAFNGLRPSETLGLYFDDMDLADMKLRLMWHEGERYGPKMKKPTDKPRWIPLNPLSAELHKQIPRLDRRIIPVSYNTLLKWWKRSIKHAGIPEKPYPLTMHKLRHFFAHFWIRKKGSVPTLKDVMRHSKIEYTLIYTKPSEDEMREEFQKVIS